MPIDDPKFKAMLIKHEGIKLRPYVDSLGVLSIGVGRNLQDVGITATEAEYLLMNDLARTLFLTKNSFKFFDGLNPARQDVILSMVFNMGLGGISKFHGMLKALDERNYALAADEMLNSVWARQVKDRAQELADMMRSGTYRE